MNNLDARFALNSVTDKAYTEPIVSDGSSPVYLKPLDSVIVQPTTLPIRNVALNIDVDEGIYRMILLSSETPANQCPVLNPNNLSYGYVFYYTYVDEGYNSTTSSYYIIGSAANNTKSGFFNDIQAGVTDIGPAISYWLISTYTSNKQVFIQSGSNMGEAIHSIIWNDTTTKWFSLGTIFPFVTTNEFAQFKAYIERLR